MPGEQTNTSTAPTGTTSETTTQPEGGSETETGQNEALGLADALGDGSGKAAADSDSGTAQKSEDKPAAAPEKYEAFTVPEGHQLDAELAEAAGALFKKHGLSQEAAQELVNFYSENAVKTAKATQDSIAAMKTGWVKEMKADPVLGKLTAKDGNFGPDSPLVQTISRAMDGLQNPKLVGDFKAAMNLTGAGDNPAFVRVLYALASQVTEGTSYAQGGPPGGGKAKPASAAAAVYPNLKSQSDS